MDFFHSNAFAERVRTLMQKHHVPGLAVAIVHRDKVASLAFGKASMDPEVPFTTDTLFDMASCSKSLTAASVALLLSDEEQFPNLQYETPVSKLLPEDFVLPKQSYTDDVTVEDILSHRSGMPRHDTSYLGPQAAHPDTTESVTRSLRDLPLAAPIRSKFMYNNMMYTVAAHLVAKTSSMSFSDFLEEKFFQPLGMTSTNLQPSLARSKGLADRISRGHIWKQETSSYGSWPAWDAPEAEGAGSIVSSVNDYIKYIQAILQRKPPFSEDLLEGLLKPRMIIEPEEDPEESAPWTSPSLYAAGWEVSHYRGYKVVGHDGAVQGFESDHFFLPSLDFGAVLVGSSSSAGVVNEILKRELVDEVLNVPQAERPDWAAHVERLRAKWKSDDAAKAEKLREESSVGVEDLQLTDRLPPSAYVGEYHNAGYKSMTVQERDGVLFVDASDRSFPCKLAFEHVAGQSKYIAHISDNLEGGDEPIKAQFEITDAKAVRMGLDLEDDLGDMIWFDRVE